MGTANVFSTYDPTSLFAGEAPVRSREITLAGGQNAAPVANGAGGLIPTPIRRGTLLGRSVSGEATTAPKTGGNTGTGTITMDASTPVLPAAIAGAYKVNFTAATAFAVVDPTGATVGTGTVGTAFSTGNEIKFNTAAGGTAFVAGDSFSITVVPTDEYVISKTTATDGSQIPVAILAADTDTSSGPVATVAYFEGEFAGEIMILDPSWSIAALQAATRQAGSLLFIRSVGVLG